MTAECVSVISKIGESLTRRTMAKPKVLATRPLFPAAQEILDAACEAEYWTKPERIPREELLSRIKDKEGLVCLLTEKVNLELLSAAPKSRDSRYRPRRTWIGSYPRGGYGARHKGCRQTR